MNKIELLDKLQSLFDSDEVKKSKDVEKVLDKLKDKQKKNRKMLDQCNNIEFKKALELEIDVLEAQIEKGEKFLQTLLEKD